MKVGLLVCDHVRDRHIDIAGDYSDHFRALFAEHPQIDLVLYDVINGEMPERPDECDAWLTTGSRHSVNDDAQWIRDLETFVQRVAEAEVPFVGICFGHQMLAKALGGTVVSSDRSWGVGSKEVETANGAFRVMNMHQDQVGKLPPGAEILGWNEHCPISVMGIGDSMLGVQGHPEMSRPYVEQLLEERRGSVIPEDIALAGLDSLDDPPDTQRLAQWIADFLTRSEASRVPYDAVLPRDAGVG